MLFVFIVLLIIANSSLIYASDTNDTIEDLFTQSADNLPEDSISTNDNSDQDIINITNEDINNINENQNDIESSSNSSNGSVSESLETNDNSDYDNSQINNSTEETSEKTTQLGNTSTTNSN